MECAVCLDPVKRGRQSFTPKCKHTLHAACFAQWQERNATCPTCRRPIPVRPSKENAPAHIRRRRGEVESRALAQRALLRLQQEADVLRLNARQRAMTPTPKHRRERAQHLRLMERQWAHLERALARERCMALNEAAALTKRFRLDNDVGALKAAADVAYGQARGRASLLSV